MIRYSFIIPVKAINDYIRESVPIILKIQRDDYEILIYPDETSPELWPKTRQIPTGHCGPATKRTMAIEDAKGEFLVFIDDDAYPQGDFLDILDRDFRDPKVLAVGGPAITPDDDSFWQKVSGAVFLSALSGGCPERYVPIGSKKRVDDWPSVNFSMRKEIFAELGGFASEYWPGEDTKLCLDMIKRYPNSILYDPELTAYHHRRAGFARHLKQIGGYGLHRGFFAKKYPETSFRVKYFIPSLFLLFVIGGGIASMFSTLAAKLYLAGWLVYGVALLKAFSDIYKYEKNMMVVLNAVYTVFFTHLAYGYSFIKGFVFTDKLVSKLR